MPSPQAAWVVSAPGDPDGIPDGEYGRHAAGSGIPVAGLRDPRLAQNIIVSHYSELTVVVVCYACTERKYVPFRVGVNIPKHKKALQ